MSLSLLHGPHPLKGIRVTKGVKAEKAENNSSVVALTLSQNQTVWMSLEEDLQQINQSWFAPSYMNITAGVNKAKNGTFSAVVNGNK